MKTKLMQICSGTMAVCLVLMAYASCTVGGTRDQRVVAGSLSRVSPSPREERMGDGNTPDGILRELRVAYEGEQLERYGNVLDEWFRFHFEPAIADSLGLPPDQPWWGKTKDLSSTSRMFGSSQVTSIEIELDRLSGWSACLDGVTGRTALCARVEPDIRITIESPGGDPWHLVVNRSWLDVVIVEDSVRTGFWTILAIYETLEGTGRTLSPQNAGVVTDDTTWSEIKALFR
jgi:hypothetical protein